MASKEAGNNPGLCPVYGQLPGVSSRTRARSHTKRKMEGEITGEIKGTLSKWPERASYFRRSPHLDSSNISSFSSSSSSSYFVSLSWFLRKSFFKFRLAPHHEMWAVEVYIHAFMNSALGVVESPTSRFRYFSSQEQALAVPIVTGNF